MGITCRMMKWQFLAGLVAGGGRGRGGQGLALPGRTAASAGRGRLGLALVVGAGGAKDERREEGDRGA